MNPEIIDFIEWLFKSDWYFDKDNLWKKDGYKSRTTQQLFEFYNK